MAGVVSVAAVLAFQLIVFPVPVGVWVQGLVLGLLGSLMAVGLGLTYRLNKVVNFAQGDLGTAPAVLAVGLIAFSGVNYFVGLLTGLVAVVVLTFCAEFVVVRRFRRSPRLILTVATIGLSQVLVVVSLLIPRIWGQTPISTAVVMLPWQFTWHITPIVFDANDLVAVIVSVACLAGVSLWFTRTDVGIAVQAAGDRRDRASMLGIPVGRLQSVTWVVAGTLGFVSIFFQAAILGLPLDPTYGLTALVTALAASGAGQLHRAAGHRGLCGRTRRFCSRASPGTSRRTRRWGWRCWPAWYSPRYWCASSLPGGPIAPPSRRWRWPGVRAICPRRPAT